MGLVLAVIGVPAWVWLTVKHWRYGPASTLLLASLGAAWLTTWGVIAMFAGDPPARTGTIVLAVVMHLGGLGFGCWLLQARHRRAVTDYQRRVDAQARFEMDVRQRVEGRR